MLKKKNGVRQVAQAMYATYRAGLLANIARLHVAGLDGVPEWDALPQWEKDIWVQTAKAGAQEVLYIINRSVTGQFKLKEDA